MNTAILNHLNENSLLVNAQMRFRRNRSTTGRCLGLVDESYSANDDGLALVAVFFDLAKAFNMVNYVILF